MSDDKLEANDLAGTVGHYARHLFVCTGNRDWPSHIHERGGFVTALWQALKDQAEAMPRFVKFTACDLPSSGDGHDVLLFPDGVRYHGLQEGDIAALVEDHLVGDTVSPRLTHSRLDGQYVFVCAHTSRDKRCGDCGPGVVARFEAELADQELSERVMVSGCSHVGQHHLAGNVLVYPGGDWYGRVTAGEVPRLVAGHVAGGEVVGDLWRGRMGMTQEAQREYARRWA